MELSVTNAISELVIERFCKDTVSTLVPFVLSRAHFLKGEPTKWFKLMGDELDWNRSLKKAATAFFARILAGNTTTSDLWKDKAKVAWGLEDSATAPLRLLGQALFDAKAAIGADVEIEIGISFPDEEYGTRFVLPCESWEDTVLTLGFFAANVTAIVDTISAEIRADNRPSEGVRLEIRPDGDILLHWQHQRTLEAKTRSL